MRLASERHLRDLEASAGAGFPYRFDDELASVYLDFFKNCLSFGEGIHAGEPFELRGFQAFIVGSIFGWIDKATGVRRFRSAYCEIAKGNGKTPLAAGIGLAGLVIDNEPGAEIYSAAVTRDQAGILFSDAKKMVNHSPELAARLYVGVNQITEESSGSFFRPVSSEARSLDGKRVHFALIDELHEHRDALVVDKMEAGAKGRLQPLTFEITNAGYDRKSVCWQHRERARLVLEDIFQDETLFAYISTLDPCEDCRAKGETFPKEGCSACDDWQDPAAWTKANPNLGVSVTEAYLQKQVSDAKLIPAKQGIVKRLNFGIWTQQLTKWLSMEAWDRCTRSEIDMEQLRGRVCYAGLDLASNIDLNSLVLVFPPARMPRIEVEPPSAPRARTQEQLDLLEDGGPIEALPEALDIAVEELDEDFIALFFFWIPDESMRERSRRDHVPYDHWVKAGWIEATEGNVTDYRKILARIEQLLKLYRIKALRLDRWGSEGITTDLQEIGFMVDPEKAKLSSAPLLSYFGQGFASMSGPAKNLQRLVLQTRLRVGKNPVARWNADNVVIEQDAAGNIKPNKARSPEKIDGIVALIMALAGAIAAPSRPTSRYETQGIRTL